MDVSELFGSSLRLIERVARGICRRERLYGADADDFVSAATLSLIDNDYAVLRSYEGRSSLATFLAVVFQRLLFDDRNRNLGRWRPSREAERMGKAGMLLETLIRRDRRTLDEAMPLLLDVDPSLSRDEAERMLDRLPERALRPRAVELDEEPGQTFVAAERADTRVVEEETRQMSEVANAVMRQALEELSVDDRMLIRMRFGSSLSVSEIARMLRLPQRPLYRRIEVLLHRLRGALLAAGVDASAALDIISTASNEMDFGLTAMENGVVQQSTSVETSP